MAKRKGKKRRSFSEKVTMVLGILIALSMVLALVASFFPGGGGVGF